MTLPEAIEQLKVIQENLKRVNLQYVSKETIKFRLKSLEAIEVILKELRE